MGRTQGGHGSICDKSRPTDRSLPGAAGGVQWKRPAFNPAPKALSHGAQWLRLQQGPMAIDLERLVTAVDAAGGKSLGQLSIDAADAGRGPQHLAAVAVFAGELTRRHDRAGRRHAGKELTASSGGPMVGGKRPYSGRRPQYVAQ